VPAGRETLELGAIFWRPGQAELLAPYTHRYLEELTQLKGGMLNQGVVVRAMYPTPWVTRRSSWRPKPQLRTGRFRSMHATRCAHSPSSWRS
jgi:hypothetical protein